MTTATDVIAALNQRRLLKAGRLAPAGVLPAGWQRWLDAQPRLDRAAAGAPPGAFVDAFAQRPLRAVPRRAGELTRLEALGSLLGQDWAPDTGEDRRLRIGVSALDIVLHVVLVAALLWLMYVQFLAISQAPDADDGAVQVEFIGRGNVEAGGGALAAAGAESSPAAAAPRAARAGQAPDAAAAGAPQPEAAGAPDTAAPADVQAAQPLQVTEVEVADAEAFQLPPPRLRAPDLPQVELREAQPRRPVDEVVALPAQAASELRPEQRALAVRVPELRTQPREVEVVEPLQPVRERAAPSLAQRDPTAAIRQAREIPLPAGGATVSSPQPGSAANPTAASPAGAGGARGNAPTTGQAPAGTGQGARPATQGGRGVAATGPGAGPAPRAAPGGWPGPARSDDWGASTRNVAGTGTGSGSGAGGRPGLFNDDGSVRLSDEWAQASGVNVDTAGTWLQRPGLEYRGTRFDRYWIPQGTLLQEWVRRGIKRVAIPIPGTNTRLECVVSLLQLGGGCFPVNPDMNEQPATARPPPDVPFKPELQEDNGSRRPGS